jgi:hypothetical protein
MGRPVPAPQPGLPGRLSRLALPRPRLSRLPFPCGARWFSLCARNSVALERLTYDRTARAVISRSDKSVGERTHTTLAVALAKCPAAVHLRRRHRFATSRSVEATHNASASSHHLVERRRTEQHRVPPNDVDLARLAAFPEIGVVDAWNLLPERKRGAPRPAVQQQRRLTAARNRRKVFGPITAAAGCDRASDRKDASVPASTIAS